MKSKPQPAIERTISPLVPRRASGTSGRRPPLYPDLNFQAISQQLGISSTWLGRIMNGVYRPSMQLAERLAALLGWSLDQVNALYKPKPEMKSESESKGEPDGKSRNNRSKRRRNQGRKTH